MKTMFGRQFFMTACLILICILLLGISFRLFLNSYITGERQESLYYNAQASTPFPPSAARTTS